MTTNNLQIKISAKNKTARAFRAVKAGLGGIASAAFSMRTAIGLAAGVAGLGYLVKKSMNATDEMAKMSRAVGVSVETLQRYHHAANLGGLTTKQLDKAVQKFAINIQEVSTGVGMAKDAFEQYGIAATNTDGSLRSVESVMDDVADAMAGITNKTELAAFAYDMFGGRGAAMVNVLKDGKEALRASMREADKFGLVMSGKTVTGVEDANDAITRLTSYLGAVFNRVVATLAPTIQSATDALREFVEIKINKAGGIAEFSKNIAVGVLSATKAIIAGFNLVINSVISLANKLNFVADIWAKVFGDQRMTQDVKNEIDKIDNAIVAVIKSVGKWHGVSRDGGREAILDYRLQQAALQELIDTGKTYTADKPLSLIDLSASQDAVGELLSELSKVNMLAQPTKKVKTLDDVNKPLRQKDAGIKAEQERITKILRLNYGLYGELRNMENNNNSILRSARLDHFAAIQMKQTRFQANQVENEKKANEKKVRLAYTLYGAYRLVGEKTQTVWTETADNIKSAYDAISDSITNTLTDLLVDGGNWGDAMKSIINDVYKEFIRKQIASPLVSAGGDAMSSIFNSMFSPAPITGVRAMGGPVGANKSFLVGESGPEIFTPSSNGHITANSGESQPVNITYNIKSWDSRDTMTTLQQNAPQIVGIIQEAFQKRGQRGFA
jgi:hypothetical protein